MPEHRTKLVHIVISFELDIAFQKAGGATPLRNFDISSERFMALSEEIHRLFPTESQCVYYVPYKSKGKQKTLAGGKWLEHWKYVKGRLRRDGILLREDNDENSEPSEENESQISNGIYL